jgi:membrane protease subunit (stomatin/prohibitin family)
MGFIKKQFIDVIDWTEPGDGILAYRYPMTDREIQNGGQLTVRDSQLAVFVNEGKIADVFTPGLYTLNTRTLPILTNLKNWDKAFASPFKSDVYFFSTREHLDQKWGTPQPVTFRDKEMGPVRIRAFGTYSYQLADPKLFYQKISGTRDLYSAAELDGQLRSAIITQMATTFGAATVGFLDMAANQQAFSDTLKSVLAPMFQSYGLTLSTFFVQSVSLPEDVQKFFDKASSMRMLGDLGKYTQFQAAESMMAAAQNPSGGGAASAGVGLGAGMAMGQAMAGALGASGMGVGGGVGGGPAAQAEDPIALIEKLHDLMKKGVLGEEEFNAKKAELLKRVK